MSVAKDSIVVAAGDDVVEIMYVNPQMMMLVTIKEMSGEEVKYAAVACVYIPVAISGSKESGIAIEVVIDPEMPAPSSVYPCPVERLTGIVLSPNRLLKVVPYVRQTENFSS